MVILDMIVGILASSGVNVETGVIAEIIKFFTTAIGAIGNIGKKDEEAA